MKKWKSGKKIIAVFLVAALLIPGIAAGLSAGTEQYQEGAALGTEGYGYSVEEEAISELLASEEAFLLMAFQDGGQMATQLESISDDEEYRLLAKKVLTYYYENELWEQLADFTAASGPRGRELAEAFAAAKEERESAEELNYIPGQVLVVYEGGGIAAMSATEEDSPVSEVLEVLELPGEETAALAEISIEHTVETAVEALEEQPGVAYAQPNYIYVLMDDLANDPKISSQAYLGNIGVPEAWALLEGYTPADPGHKARVAVLDTNPLSTHEDLQANVRWDLARDFSAGTVAGAPHNSGYADNHGTHVIGIIAATANNGLGVVGVASGKANDIVEVVPITVFSQQGASTTVVLANALKYAQDQDVDVVNMSIGLYEAYDKTLKDAIDNVANGTAEKKGAVIVAAAGNRTTVNGVTWEPPYKCYPADFDNVISVVNLADGGALASGSNYQNKDIGAPGSGIYSTFATSNSTYSNNSGTSMSAPMVAATAAMVRYVNPELSVDEVRQILLKSAKKNTNANTPEATLNTGGAVAAAIGTMQLSGTVAISGDCTYGVTLSADISGVLFPPGKDESNLQFQWTSKEGNAGAVDIVGATNASYTVLAGDIGKEIGLRVSCNGSGTLTAAGKQAGKADMPPVSNPEIQVTQGVEKSFSLALASYLPELAGGMEYGTTTYSLGTGSGSSGVIRSGSLNLVQETLSFDMEPTAVAGSATIEVEINPANYKPSVLKIKLVVVEKKQVAVTGISVADADYDGQPHGKTGDPVFTANGKGRVYPQYSLVYESTDGGGYSSTNPPTAAGEYKAILAVNSDQEYSGSWEGIYTIRAEQTSGETPGTTPGGEPESEGEGEKETPSPEDQGQTTEPEVPYTPDTTNQEKTTTTATTSTSTGSTSSSRSGSGGGGGGGGGGGSAATAASATASTVAAVAPRSANVGSDGVVKTETLLKEYRAQASGIVNVQNAVSLPAAAWNTIAAEAAKAGKAAQIRAKTTDVTGKSIQGMLYLTPSLLSGRTEALRTGIYVDKAKTSARLTQFTRFYSNKIVVVHCEEPVSFGARVRIAVKVDLSAMNLSNLHFYSYNAAANSFTAITSPNYWVDTNGYLHFETTLAGDIVISDGPLARK